MQQIRPKAGLLFPVNVKVIQKSTNGDLIKNFVVKNRVLKEYGLYSYVRFLIGDFHNNVLENGGQYIPKYLAVGSNEAPITGAPGTTPAVQITDISLFHENFDNNITGESIDKVRIPLNRANYIEDDDSEPFLKIQYEAYIPENRFVGQTIGELALMTESTGWNAFARISGFEPFVKEPNTVVQVIWEITIISIESSTRFVPPIKTYLRECIEKAIDVLWEFKDNPSGISGDAREALNHLIQPSSNTNTGLYLLLNDNEQITQELINNFLSKPFVSITDTGLIPLIQKFDPTWKPPSIIPPIDD